MGNWATASPVCCGRKGFGLPGMRVLQFAFSGGGDILRLPRMQQHESVVYTGGTVHGNWRWRLPADALTRRVAQHFAQINIMYGRI